MVFFVVKFKEQAAHIKWADVQIIRAAFQIFGNLSLAFTGKQYFFLEEHTLLIFYDIQFCKMAA